jgi:hypothetical protein
MKVVLNLIFLLICADNHAPEKTRRKTEFGKSREKSLSRKPRQYLAARVGNRWRQIGVEFDF